MITRLVTHISGPNTDGSTWTVDVEEDWDTVFNHVYPLQGPSSALEHRENMWYNKVGGGRIAIGPSNIYSFEEVPDE
jgi:hypothetical protein